MINRAGGFAKGVRQVLGLFLPPLERPTFQSFVTAPVIPLIISDGRFSCLLLWTSFNSRLLSLRTVQGIH